MQATEVMTAIKRLPKREAVRLYDLLFAEESEWERLLAAFDHLPRRERLTEPEILALPRARAAR